MKNMSRAIRRHHAARLKRARRFYFAFDNRSDPRRLGMVLHTPTPCSCWMCGNPRRYVGPTRAEVLHFIRLAEEAYSTENRRPAIRVLLRADRDALSLMFLSSSHDRTLAGCVSPAGVPAMPNIRLRVTENTLSDPARITHAMYEDFLEQSGGGWVADTELRERCHSPGIASRHIP